jgi:hypothetical protein
MAAGGHGERHHDAATIFFDFAFEDVLRWQAPREVQ